MTLIKLRTVIKINKSIDHRRQHSFSNAFSKRKCGFFPQHHGNRVKVAHTRLPSIGFRSWSRFLAVSLQVMWVINQAVGCHYFPPGLQLRSQPLRGLLPILLLGEQRHNECEQFAYDCYPTASRLRFEPRPFHAWVQHANHSATEPPLCNTMVTE